MLTRGHGFNLLCLGNSFRVECDCLFQTQARMFEDVLYQFARVGDSNVGQKSRPRQHKRPQVRSVCLLISIVILESTHVTRQSSAV